MGVWIICQVANKLEKLYEETGKEEYAERAELIRENRRKEMIGADLTKMHKERMEKVKLEEEKKKEAENKEKFEEAEMPKLPLKP